MAFGEGSGGLKKAPWCSSHAERLADHTLSVATPDRSMMGRVTLLKISARAAFLTARQPLCELSPVISCVMLIARPDVVFVIQYEPSGMSLKCCADVSRQMSLGREALGS